MLQGLTQQLKLPDAWQHQAVNHLRAGSDVIVSAPTGAGKTYIFELFAKAQAHKRQLVYTVPTRALANDKFAEWTEAGWKVGLATGDRVVNVQAPILVATLETQIERLISGDGPELLVMDEYQMIADSSRGSHYEGAIILTPPNTQLLLLSGSVENPKDVTAWMQKLGRKVEIITTQERPVPLEDAPLDVSHPRLKNIEGRWPKLISAALLADLAPVLIFAPRRKDAESIAARLAAHLPPGEPLALTQEQRQLAGKDMTALLEKRVAHHHSGLSYAVRAGLVEPLAKAGQLRVVVSTMGLAAGINFSVRSVHVAGTTFHDGVSEQQLTADELLQMFGRAGRRGLDERGYVITNRDGPTLADARPAHLRRSSKLSWPLFLRVMHHAAQTGTDPFDAATDFAGKLFARMTPDLGLATENDSSQLDASGTTLFGLTGTKRELLNSEGQWEVHPIPTPVQIPLSDTWLSRDGFQGAALANTHLVDNFAPKLGRLFKLPNQGNQYGKEIALGQIVQVHTEDENTVGTQTIIPTKALRKLLQIPRHIETLSHDKVLNVLLPKLASYFPDAKLMDLPENGTTLWARFDFSHKPVQAIRDSKGRWLYDAVFRSSERIAESDIKQQTTSNAKTARNGTAIHAWRTLGLIQPDGTPTQRGVIFSCFQHGEGLAIAAALEDETYPLDELVYHLANLRGAFHMELIDAYPSERLSAICRATYGFVNHQGYLESGLPVGYGEATAELLGLGIDSAKIHLAHEKSTEGDLTRAYVEWLSLLRHLKHAPEHDWDRWSGLKKLATTVLEQHLQHASSLIHPKLPPLTPKQKHTRPHHYLLRK